MMVDSLRHRRHEGCVFNWPWVIWLLVMLVHGTRKDGPKGLSLFQKQSNTCTRMTRA